MNTLITQRISALRQLMRQHSLVAYIVPGTDPHASEYMAEHWMETTWLSGFKGETGTVVVTLHEAFLWTDSRYYLQAEKELAGTGIALMRESDIDTPTIPQWLTSVLHKADTVGVNPEMFSVAEYARLQAQLSTAGITLHSIDLIHPLWTDNRPDIPTSPLYEYKEKYAGESIESKLTRVRQELQRHNADTMVISALDEIAWLLNIRGTDVDYNPVVISYLLLEKDRCTLFVAPEKVTPEAMNYLTSHHIALQDYNNICTALSQLGNSTAILYDGTKLNRALYEALPAEAHKTDTLSPVQIIKSVKNSTEIEGERTAMKKDAVALTRFFMWLEQAVHTGQLTEYDLMQKLHEFRAEQPDFIEESFCTIAGYQGNGAIVHYQATENDCATVLPTGMLLLDSGGQYLDGTTDITRTVCFDEPTEQMKHDFTLVLKGHIALACARFPKGTRGNQLDILARQYLWQEALSYGHGTGHGVGHFLGCHEGPQNIRTDNNPAPLQIGNICSDEPGIYRTGQYGIRTENLICVVPCTATEFGEFLCFETLTLCFYDTRLIQLDLLTEQERNWVNTYHKRVISEVSPLLTAEEAQWLADKCKEI